MLFGSLEGALGLNVLAVMVATIYQKLYMLYAYSFI